MSKITKRVVVEFEFESSTEEVPHIKDWWLKSRVSGAIKNALPHMRDGINHVTVEHTTTTVLPEEITVKMEDILCRV